MSTRPQDWPDRQGCDYCGQTGCRWENHPEARAEWRREAARQEFPFGDHREGEDDA